MVLEMHFYIDNEYDYSSGAPWTRSSVELELTLEEVELASHAGFLPGAADPVDAVEAAVLSAANRLATRRERRVCVV